VYTALRTLAGILVGTLVSFVLVVAVEFFSAVVHPLPKGFGGTMEELCRHVERYPQWVLAFAVVAWAVTAFAGTWTARRIGSLGSFAVVGFLLLAAVVFNIAKLPYPLWFKFANLLGIPAAIVAGGRLSRRNPTAGTNASE
jgi:hypothetical protein